MGRSDHSSASRLDDSSGCVCECLGQILLKSSKTHHFNKFEKGNSDEFFVEVDNIGELKHIRYSNLRPFICTATVTIAAAAATVTADSFLPRDSLARSAVYNVEVCPSVRPSVFHTCFALVSSYVWNG